MDVLSIIIEFINSCEYFSQYKDCKKSMTNVGSSIMYDVHFEAKNYDRWLFIRVEDSVHKKKIRIWINQLKQRKANNVDLEILLKTNLLDTKNKKLFEFSSLDEDHLAQVLNKICTIIGLESNDKILKVIRGIEWVESDFDWHGYK